MRLTRVLLLALIVITTTISCDQKSSTKNIVSKYPHDGVYVPQQIWFDVKYFWVISGNRLDVHYLGLKTSQTLYIEQAEKFIKVREEKYLAENNEIFVSGDVFGQNKMMKISDDTNMNLEKVKNMMDTIYQKKSE